MTQYGDGSTASGECGTDTLVLGGLSVENQVIETASKVSTQFSRATGDGLIGLAWGKINTVTDHGKPDPQPTPVENMIEQKDIPKESELFTSAFYSTRDEGKESFFTFGYIDQDLLKSLGEDIHWTKVDNSKGFWSVPSESVSINGKKIKTEGNTAVMDTGTSLALVSDEVVDALYAKIHGTTYDEDSQGYIIPSNVTLEELPEFKVAIGDKLFVIQKESLLFSPIEGGSWYGGVQSRGNLDFDILGDVALKSIYAVSPTSPSPSQMAWFFGTLTRCVRRSGTREPSASAPSRRSRTSRTLTCLMFRAAAARSEAVRTWCRSSYICSGYLARGTH